MPPLPNITTATPQLAPTAPAPHAPQSSHSADPGHLTPRPTRDSFAAHRASAPAAGPSPGPGASPLEPGLPAGQLNAAYGPDARRELEAAVRAAFPQHTQTPGTMGLIIRTLLQVPRHERREAVALIAHLAARGSLRESQLQTVVLNATPVQRREHARRLRHRERPATRPGGAEDLESVMQGALRHQTDGAVAKLQARFPNPMPLDAVVREVALYLQDRHRATRDSPTDILKRQRGGDTEENNAVRTLCGPMRAGDYSKSVIKTPPMARLVALVWTAANAERPGIAPEQAARDRDLMCHGIVMALAKCIEDDGHRVCGVGQRQYLVDALKGFYAEAGDAQQSVTPRALVTVLTADFYAAHGDAMPTPDQVTKFTADARQTASERFGAASAALADFTEQFDTYMRMTY